MANSAGLWIAIGEGPLLEKVAASIERDAQFSTTVAEPAVKPRHAELVIVSMDGTSADFVGISQAGRRVATGQITIVISNLVAIKRLSTDVIRRKLP